MGICQLRVKGFILELSLLLSHFTKFALGIVTSPRVLETISRMESRELRAWTLARLSTWESQLHYLEAE